jgi:peroxiredoxin Q/BCP
MQRTLLGFLLTVALTAPAWAALKSGDMAPDFSAQASLAGKAFSYSLADALKKGPVVVYFYPSAFTEGCNVEAHTFSVRRGEFDAAGATIIGVSLDNIDRLNDFSADPKYCAGKIAVASDADGKIVAAYKLKVANAPTPVPDSRGVLINHGFAERTTFVVTPDGKIASAIGGASPTANVEAALKSVQQIAKDKAK